MRLLIVVWALTLLFVAMASHIINIDNITNGHTKIANSIERISPPIEFGGNSISEDVSGLAFRFSMNNIDITTQNGTKAVYDNASVVIDGETYKITNMGVIAHNGDKNAEYTLEDVDNKSVINIPAVYLYDLDSENNVATFVMRITNIPDDKYDVQLTAIPYAVIEIDGNEATLYGEKQSNSYNNTLSPKPKEDTIPEGGVYTALHGPVYQSGDKFPTEVNDCDRYKFGDYEYVYRESSKGWHVYVLDKTLSEYDEFLPEIANRPITNLSSTFWCCSNMTTAPKIPASVTYMSSTFAYCTSLTGPIHIDADPDGYTDCFKGVNFEKQGIILEGKASFTTKNELKLSQKTPSLSSGSKYVFEDYTYIFNSSQKVWTLTVNEKNKEKYSEILHHVYTYPVTRLDYAFEYCSSMTEAPILPCTTKSMSATFHGCSSLKVAPEIPEGITSLKYTFYGCSSLEVAPKIPSTVAYMDFTFRDCTSLVVAPEIPSTMYHMEGTFHTCTSMTTAPVIPESVVCVKELFRQCTSLTGTIEFNASTYSDDCCFFNVDFQKQKLTLTGTSELMDRIAKSGMGYCNTCNGYCYE